MWKMLGLLVVGLAVGAGISLYMRPGAAAGSLLVAGADAQSMDVQKSLAALDRRVRELTMQVQALQGSGRTAAPAAGAAPAADGQPRRPGDDWPAFQEGRTPANFEAMRERREQFQNERIAAAGMTPERMKTINRRVDELRVAAQQAQFDAQRTGQPVQGVNIDQTLRKELGDAEFERYLKAEGRSTEVRVMEVLATSAAERAGLKAGDEIVSYGGTRVFDARELSTLTTQGTSGGSVTVEVKRDGQTVQLTVPRGPLGVESGGNRGGPGPGGGPPGGFRGGRP
jgi:membrane-associated protease RseP (regulator of RpoE activity)